MEKITGVEAITVSSQLLPAVSPDLLSAHRLTVAVDYRDTYRTTVFMDVLYDLVREALDGLLPAAPTLTGWQHLTTSLYGRGSSAWASAVHGKAERLEIRNVQLDGEPGAAALRLLGTANFHGTWATSPGVDYPLVQGTAKATLDQTPGPPGFMAPVGDVWGETLIPLRGIACVDKWLCGPGYLELAAFDSSIALDLNRVYHTIETLFYGEVFRWHEFLEGWEVLFSGAVLSVDIRTVSYSLALVPSEAAYQEAIAPYSQLMADRHPQELDTPTLEPQAWRASHALGRRGSLAATALLAT
jgi:hypothetical protein